VKGETTEEYIKRQHEIDDIQRHNQKFINPYTWKDSYDVEEITRAKASELRKEEGNTWRLNRIAGVRPDHNEAILASQDND
jgi:hypothetical protein